MQLVCLGQFITGVSQSPVVTDLHLDNAAAAARAVVHKPSQPNTFPVNNTAGACVAFMERIQQVTF